MRGGILVQNKMGFHLWLKSPPSHLLKIVSHDLPLSRSAAAASPQPIVSQPSPPQLHQEECFEECRAIKYKFTLVNTMLSIIMKDTLLDIVSELNHGK